MAGVRDAAATQLLAGMLKLSDADHARLVPCLYTPDGVKELVAEMDPLVQLKRKNNLTAGQQQDLGYMLEDLGLLIFQSLAG